MSTQSLPFLAMVVGLFAGSIQAQEPWIVFNGADGPGKGKHVVLVSGEGEYRSEETLPQLAKILARHHGFKCTVLFAIDPKDGTINPGMKDNIPGLESLKNADLLILFTRHRTLPDEQMAHLAGYVESGKPILGLRTATHAFANKSSKQFAKYYWKSKDWPGGFGKQVLGETWIGHHGSPGQQSTRGILVKGEEKHPILRGIKDGDIWGPSNVYTVTLPLPGDSKPLVLGQVLKGLKATDDPLPGAKNDPMLPIAWTRTFTGDAGKKARIFTTTMGSSQDLANEGFRRLLVNASYWALSLEDQISPSSKVDIVGDYHPRPVGENGFLKGVRPADLK